MEKSHYTGFQDSSLYHQTGNHSTQHNLLYYIATYITINLWCVFMGYRYSVYSKAIQIFTSSLQLHLCMLKAGNKNLNFVQREICISHTFTTTVYCMTRYDVQDSHSCNKISKLWISKGKLGFWMIFISFYLRLRLTLCGKVIAWSLIDCIKCCIWMMLPEADFSHVHD